MLNAYYIVQGQLQEKQECEIICCLSLVLSMLDNGSQKMMATGNPFFTNFFKATVTHTSTEHACMDNRSTLLLMMIAGLRHFITMPL